MARAGHTAGVGRRHVATLLLSSLAVAGSLGCDGSGGGLPDAIAPGPDRGTPSRDAGPDGCVPGQGCDGGTSVGAPLCAPLLCSSDEQCGGPKDDCLVSEGGLPFCARACDAQEPCPPGYACKGPGGVAATRGQCVPQSGRCDRTGESCGADRPCTGPESLCATMGGAARCTRACASAADCPQGFKACLPDDGGRKVCQPLPDPSSASCGVRASDDGLGAACATAGCPSSASVCAPAGNRLGVAFCTRGCDSDLACGPEAFCAPLPPLGGTHCVPYRCACAAEPTPLGASLGKALAQVKRTSCDVGHRYGDLRKVYAASLTDDPFRLSSYNRLYYAPLAVPAFRARLLDRVRAAKASPEPVGSLLRLAAELWDEPLPDPLPATASSPTFEEAVVELHAGDGRPRGELLAELAPKAKELPLVLKAKLVPLLVALRRAIALRHEALAALLPDEGQLLRFFSNLPGIYYRIKPGAMVGGPIDLAKELDRTVLERQLRYAKLAEAAAVLARAVETSGLRELTVTGTFSFNHLTPVGRLVIGDGRDQVYRADDPAFAGDLALLVDVGGDDRYELAVGANRSVRNPISLAIDLGGRDRYGYAAVPGPYDGTTRPVSDADGRAAPPEPPQSQSMEARQGAGRLGVGMLFDYGKGDDRYESLRFSQGFGELGVGVLFDDGGNDLYRAEAGAQGSALFGLGLLVDLGGDDEHQGYTLVQGASLVKGVGLLADLEGDDTYRTEPGNTYIRKSQRRKQDDYLYSASLSQGAAEGRRGDFPPDGIANQVHSSGGLGLLVDLAGADRYTCGAFCQGAGYWFGLGVLLDAEGNDRYDGRVYCLGAGAHFGLGLFHDARGDDSYGATLPLVGLSLGFGHDFSFAWHQDDGGADDYHGAWATFGQGSTSSTALFVNVGGDDVYSSSHYSGFGGTAAGEDYQSPTHPRHRLRVTGIFLDLGGGKDSYSRKPFFSPDPLGNDAAWVHPLLQGYTGPDGEPTWSKRAPDLPNSFGVGLDGP
ncbi:MAG: hypothetical protein IT371_06730 [Deltaproteobacteria bacterium]|nr:hypothetical protein [Deltaproteobacteria bacterium]